MERRSRADRPRPRRSNHVSGCFDDVEDAALTAALDGRWGMVKMKNEVGI